MHLMTGLLYGMHVIPNKKFLKGSGSEKFLKLEINAR